MSETKMLKVCPKCGVNHQNPGDERKAIQVLACALGGEVDFITKDGPVAKPHRDAGIA